MRRFYDKVVGFSDETKKKKENNLIKYIVMLVYLIKLGLVDEYVTGSIKFKKSIWNPQRLSELQE